jgi:hypothetical protein
MKFYQIPYYGPKRNFEGTPKILYHRRHGRKGENMGPRGMAQVNPLFTDPSPAHWHTQNPILKIISVKISKTHYKSFFVITKPVLLGKSQMLLFSPLENKGQKLLKHESF